MLQGSVYKCFQLYFYFPSLNLDVDVHKLGTILALWPRMITSASVIPANCYLDEHVFWTTWRQYNDKTKSGPKKDDHTSVIG